MKKSKFLVGALTAALALSVGATALAFSPEDYSLFGGAEYVSPGNASNRAVQLTSDATTTFSGVHYEPDGAYTFADIQSLSTDYMFTAGSCGGGSPRFQVNVASSSGDEGNIFVYIGPPPSYTGCPTGVWTNSGELIGALPVDTSQLDGGTFYDPYASALAKYGDYEVTGVQLVADGGWAFPATGQVVDVDNTVIDTVLYTYEIPVPTSKGQCKNGGWQNLADNDGNTFKNQGDCVSFVATGGRNTAQ